MPSTYLVVDLASGVKTAKELGQLTAFFEKLENTTITTMPKNAKAFGMITVQFCQEGVAPQNPLNRASLYKS